MQLGNTRINLEETADRLKISYPLQRNWLAIVVYTLLVIAWLAGLVAFLWLLFAQPRDTADLPLLLRFFWFAAVALWIYMWVRPLGGRILRWWQFNLAQRELLFIDETRLMVRRPVSIFGITEAFAREHISPFYANDTHDSLAFQYGNVKHVIFGLSLDETERHSLLTYLNGRYYPHWDEDDDEDNDYYPYGGGH